MTTEQLKHLEQFLDEISKNKPLRINVDVDVVCGDKKYTSYIQDANQMWVRHATVIVKASKTEEEIQKDRDKIFRNNCKEIGINILKCKRVKS
jgi:hypothetical protein